MTRIRLAMVAVPRWRGGASSKNSCCSAVKLGTPARRSRGAVLGLSYFQPHTITTGQFFTLWNLLGGGRFDASHWFPINQESSNQTYFDKLASRAHAIGDSRSSLSHCLDSFRPEMADGCETGRGGISTFDVKKSCELRESCGATLRRPVFWDVCRLKYFCFVDQIFGGRL